MFEGYRLLYQLGPPYHSPLPSWLNSHLDRMAPHNTDRTVGLFTAPGVYNFLDEKDQRDHLPQPFHCTGEEIKAQRGEVTRPRHHRQLTVDTGLAQGFHLPIWSFAHILLYNFITLNHGSLRAIGLNYFRPRVPL